MGHCRIAEDGAASTRHEFDGAQHCPSRGEVVGYARDDCEKTLRMVFQWCDSVVSGVGNDDNDSFGRDDDEFNHSNLLIHCQSFA
jgi:hypothetical protein